MSDDGKRYVQWRRSGGPAVVDRVQLIEGYSTEADIPRILAIARFGDVDLAGEIEVLETWI